MYTDIRKLTWIERLPEKIKPLAYLMRLDRPIGTWLLLLPALWSLVLAYKTSTSDMELRTLFTFITLFSIGAIIMRGAGCIINDLWDRDLDMQVERTRFRPLASGTISIKQTFLFLIGLLLLGLLILLQMNATTIILGVLSLVFITIYPFMKRITWWPQAFLGLTFNFGALMGWTAITGDLSLSAILLYIGGFFWTLGYDTIYAHQDITDDLLIGIKSTARLFKDKSKIFVGLFYTIAFLMFMSAIMIATQSVHPLYLCACSGILLIFQIHTWNINEQENALEMFKANKEFGLLLLLGICFI